ncbi:aldolase/citrate lyase family protein [Vibrio comitans]|uniref:HpcH/HpaI aldolase/citrate lyase domain-containing protein n=1 Tax=Vibrio comitans NBRC 102076 TaxID=1219078 RepID=A0A4Y3IR03_9VIBR|nr:aldolase/citrate lyase family protein [Vibrio comitans]GEA61969.1 hypothetical protein VCO01S_31620 [Vibrio comitans NBRC 102076]
MSKNKYFNYLFITNNPEIAKYVESFGVNRIFIDLERLNKLERQGHLDTVISKHSFDDIKVVKSSLEKADVLVRLNPFNRETKEEIELAIENGADILMLPMFRTIEEVTKFGKIIDGRVKFIPLIETQAAASIAKELDDLDCVDELHFGLNDLHLDMGLKFMFEPLANGLIDSWTRELRKPFGIGGIARANEGIVSGEAVMGQQVRLGSSGVILSRSFHMRSQNLDELKKRIDFEAELNKLELIRSRCSDYDKTTQDLEYSNFKQLISNIIKG